MLILGGGHTTNPPLIANDTECFVSFKKDQSEPLSLMRSEMELNEK